MLNIHNGSHPLGDVFYVLLIYIYSYVTTSPKVQGDEKQSPDKTNARIKERKRKTKC